MSPLPPLDGWTWLLTGGNWLVLAVMTWVVSRAPYVRARPSPLFAPRLQAACRRAWWGYVVALVVNGAWIALRLLWG